MNDRKKDYILLPPKPVIIFEVFLPQKKAHEEEYRKKLIEVLDAFLDPSKLREISLVEMQIGIEKLTNPNFVEEEYLNRIREVISGYSIYEVDGRFGGEDEKVWVIRFIIHDPRIEGGIRDDLIARSKEVLRYLITKRFAEEIGLEDEIWFVEYQNCLLQRWVNESYRKYTDN